MTDPIYGRTKYLALETWECPLPGELVLGFQGFRCLLQARC